MNISQLVESLQFRFAAAGVDNAKRVAEELLAHELNCSPLSIYVETAWETDQKKMLQLIRSIEKLVERVENGEPLQYVIGNVDFWGLTVKCDPRALIPRPETELLIEEVLSSKIWQRSPIDFADIGTGTGCIALIIATQRPDAHCTAVEISEDALSLAKENAASLNLKDRIHWKKGSLLDGFDTHSLDIVVANLPYITTDAWENLSSTVREHEPRTALDSGPSGMELIDKLTKQARTVLRPGGILFLEFGYNQGAAVRKQLEQLDYQDIQIKHDLAGLDRISIAVNPA